jgi:hypothetical protein
VVEAPEIIPVPPLFFLHTDANNFIPNKMRNGREIPDVVKKRTERKF